MNDNASIHQVRQPLSKLYLESKLDELFVSAAEVGFASDTEMSCSVRLTGGQESDIRPCFVVTFTFRGDSARHVTSLSELAGKIIDAHADDLDDNQVDIDSSDR